MDDGAKFIGGDHQFAETCHVSKNNFLKMILQKKMNKNENSEILVNMLKSEGTGYL